MLERFRFAWRPDDSEEVRLEKGVIFLVAGSCCAAGVIWCLVYLAIFGWGLLASYPAIFVAIVGTALLISHRTGNHRIAVRAQIVCIMYVPAAIQWTMGGLFDSGLVLAWSFCAPVAALIFFPIRQSVGWLGLFLLNLLVTVLFDQTFAAHGPEVSPTVRSAFLLMNMGAASAVVFLFAGYFMTTASRERSRADRLLLNILPRAIAPRLKAGEQTIADRFESASILFADMVGSTPTFAEMSAEEAVAWLNEVFTIFDRLIEQHGLEKIRTLGDSYMVASGVPDRRPDHAPALVALALDMRDAVEALPPHRGKRMRFRFGIHSGPVVAGVIGETKFQYDIWGDTVNVAARMESHGEVGRVHISAATHALIAEAYACAPRGCIDVKGRGRLETWFVIGPRDPAAGARSDRPPDIFEENSVREARDAR